MIAQGKNSTDSKISTERIIVLVRDIRNGLIKDFMNDDTLNSWFAQQYNKTISPIKLEFMKRDLKELLNSPVDLSHYAGLIRQMQEHNSASIASANHELFYQELETIFKKYNY